jgi:hypothetical protein
MIDRHTPYPGRTTWTRLVGDHDRIARQCAAICALAQRADQPVETAAIQLLELAVVVADHLGDEDQVIDLTATAIRFGASAEQAAAMTDELDVLKTDWTDFIVRWTPAAIAAQWPAFIVDAQGMMPRLAAQVRRENELLYAEAMHRGIIDTGQPILH